MRVLCGQMDRSAAVLRGAQGLALGVSGSARAGVPTEAKLTRIATPVHSHAPSPERQGRRCASAAAQSRGGIRSERQGAVRSRRLRCASPLLPPPALGKARQHTRNVQSLIAMPTDNKGVEDPSDAPAAAPPPFARVLLRRPAATACLPPAINSAQCLSQTSVCASLLSGRPRPQPFAPGPPSRLFSRLL